MNDGWDQEYYKNSRILGTQGFYNLKDTINSRILETQGYWKLKDTRNSRILKKLKKTGKSRILET